MYASFPLDIIWQYASSVLKPLFTNMHMHPLNARKTTQIKPNSNPVSPNIRGPKPTHPETKINDSY
jgi:hypothetical protein